MVFTWSNINRRQYNRNMSSTLRKKVQNNIKFSFNVETSTAAFLVIIDVPNYIRTLKIYCRHDDCYNVFNCILWNLAFVEWSHSRKYKKHYLYTWLVATMNWRYFSINYRYVPAGAILRLQKPFKCFWLQMVRRTFYWFCCDYSPTKPIYCPGKRLMGGYN